MWKLVIEDDEGKRTAVSLTRDEYTIGRKEGNSIRLTERNVSREHAKLSRKPGTPKDKPLFSLSDVSSYNGVYVNGLRVADKQDLSHGDLIQIGDYRVVLSDEAAEASDENDLNISVEPQDLKDTVSNGIVPAPLRATNATFLEKPNRLVVLAGPNPGEEFPLVGDRLTIGRAEDATISINHNSVSRLHCEVHALGDARFEIVDKGSSNGVRLNGSDLRRGIIEAGDVIELGDVKFKFVGEGQLFRPGTSESQQLAAISQRSATSVVQVGGGATSKLVPAVVIAGLLAAGVVVAFVMKGRPAQEEPGPAAEPAPTTTMADPAPTADRTGADAAMLADARRMCDIGDVEGAHKKASALPSDSPLHTSDDFRYIELKWSSMLMLQEGTENDPAAKAAILQRLTNDPYADATVKKFAAARLAAVDLASHDGGRHPLAVASSASPASPASLPASHPTTASPTRTTQAAATVEPTPVPHPAAKPPTQQTTVTDLATSANPADWQKARDILDPKVFGRRGATPDDVRLLKAICKNQHDQQCVSELGKL